jgi:hypothetical protein
MAKPKNIMEWKKTKRKYHLTDVHIQMARELGMNPKKFGGLANHKQESWKVPLPEFIEDLYFKRFKKEKPDVTKDLK